MFVSRFQRLLVLVLLLAASAGAGAVRAQSEVAPGPADAPAQAGEELAVVTTGGERPSAAHALVDFNGDGFGDLAIGVPFHEAPDAPEAGAVHVLYGRATGLAAKGNQLWTQPAVGQTDETSDFFGWALAAGDFNGDGTTDLVVGAPGEEIGGVSSAGMISVLYGSPLGLAAGAQSFSQSGAPILDNAEGGDQFGKSLAAGDYNGDGFDDVAVGAPGEDIEALNLTSVGAAHIIFGSAGGLTANGDQLIHPGMNGVAGTPNNGTFFSTALEAGDFNGDGRDDLAVGIPHYRVSGSAVGAAEVFFGAPNGLSLLGEQMWRQGAGGVAGVPEAADRFGSALAAGDFDANGVDDLAIAAPGEGVESEGVPNAGAVTILYGFGISGGLTGTGSQLWHRGQAGIQGALTEGINLGESLVAADFNGDGAADLAAGVPGDSPFVFQQGTVQVFYSNGGMLSTAGQDIWRQGVLVDPAEDGDMLGSAVGAGDFNGDGYADLAAGAVYEDVGSLRVVVDAGAVNVVRGSATGLVRSGNRIWHPQISGVLGASEYEGRFGWALTR